MTIQELVRHDMIDAMKAKSSEKVSLLKVVIGEFNRVGKEISDDKSIKIIRTMHENAKQMNNQFECEILDKYIPKMLDESKIKEIVTEIVTKNSYSSMKDMGKIMGDLKNHPNSSQIDNKIASKIIKDLLG